MQTRATPAKPFLIALAVVIVLVVGGCGALAVLVKNASPVPAAESSARNLVEELLPGRTSLSLSDQTELRRDSELTGYSWRIAPKATPTGGRSQPRTPTYFGVVACVEGDRATAGVRFSLLRWIPRGCDGGEPQLEREDRTPAQALGSLADQIGPPDAGDQTDALQRVGG